MKVSRQSQLLYLAHNGDTDAQDLLASAYAATVRHFVRELVGDDDDAYRDGVKFVSAGLKTAMEQARPDDLENPPAFLRNRIRGYIAQYERKANRQAVGGVAPVRRRVDPTPEEIESRKRELISFTPMRKSLQHAR